MLAIERKNEILSILQNEKRVLVADLSQKYKVTEETIRRDLDKLAREGFVKKTYGGAVLNENTNMDLPFKIRERTNKVEKGIIAQMVTTLVNDGETIIMDSSSTSLMVAKNLKNRKLTVITNSVEIMLELSGCKDIRLICTGGVMRDSALSLGGKTAEETLLHYNVDKAIMSCKGIDRERGVSDSNEFEADLKGIMASRARKVIWAIDSSKFDKVSFVKIMDLRAGDTVVSEQPVNEAWQSYFEEKQIQFVTTEDLIAKKNKAETEP